MSWTPHYPDTLGLEWRPVLEADALLAGGDQLVAAILTATEGADLAGMHVFVTGYDLGGGGHELPGWEFEVHDLAVATPGELQATIYRPTEDAHKTPSMLGFKIVGGSQATDLFDCLDTIERVWSEIPTGDGGTQAVDNDEWIAPIYGLAAMYDGRFGGIVGTLDGFEVTKVSVVSVCSPYADLGPQPFMTVTPYLWLKGQRFYSDPVSLSGSRPWDVVASWSANPLTGQSWTVEDVERLSAGGRDSAGWMINPTGSSNVLSTILLGYLLVEYSLTDPRLALASPDGDLHLGWNLLPFRAVTGGAGVLTLEAGHEYLFLGRRRTGAGQLRLRTLSDGVAPAHVWRTARPVIFEGSQRFANAFTEDNLPALLAVALEDVDGNIIGDSQVYASIDDDFTPAGIDRWTRVDSGRVLRCELAIPGPGDVYGFLRILARLENPDVTEALTVQVRLVSDNSAVGDPVVIDPVELAPPRDAWQPLERVITSMPVLGPEDVYVELSTTAPDGNAWAVQVASTVPNFPPPGAPPAGIEDATAGAGAEWVRANLLELFTITGAVTLSTRPDPPADLTADGDEADCVPVTTLEWTATALGEAFGRYELERSDDGGLTWQLIARVIEEDVTGAEDRECPANVECDYRVRVVRSDHSPSEWSAVATATAEMTCCGYSLSSNVRPELSLWYDDERPRTYNPPREYVERQFYNRDGAVVYRPAERPFDRFPVTLLIAGDFGHPTPVTVGRQAFAPLEDLADADLPYVCVRDRDGNRWFAALMLTGDLVRDEPSGSYTAEVTIRETTRTPYTVDLGE
jgi:hypothetical protein